MFQITQPLYTNNPTPYISIFLSLAIFSMFTPNTWVISFLHWGICSVSYCEDGVTCVWPVTTALQPDHTALSSCEANMLATGERVKEVESIQLLAQDLNIAEADACTTLYNVSQAYNNSIGSKTIRPGDLPYLSPCLYPKTCTNCLSR